MLLKDVYRGLKFTGTETDIQSPCLLLNTVYVNPNIFEPTNN